jgi:LysR family nitrogen assimilation transcriptional regulator
MELRQLRYYVTVANLSSFSRAAAQLNVAQSALSRQIRLLEEELGVQLLERTGRGAVTTAVGKVVLARATGLLAEAEGMRAAVAVDGRITGKVGLGIPAAFSGSITSRIIQLCQSEFPSVEVHVHEALSGLLLEWLGANRIDIAILYQCQIASSRFLFTPIDTRPMALIHSPTLAACGKGAPNLGEIADLPLVLYEQPHGSRLAIDSAFAQAGLTPNITHEVLSYVVLRELLQAGEGFTLMPIADMQPEIDSGHLVATPIEEHVLSRTLCLVRAKAAPSSAAAEAVFDLLGGCDMLGLRQPPSTDAVDGWQRLALVTD